MGKQARNRMEEQLKMQERLAQILPGLRKEIAELEQNTSTKLLALIQSIGAPTLELVLTKPIEEARQSKSKWWKFQKKVKVKPPDIQGYLGVVKLQLDAICDKYNVILSAIITSSGADIKITIKDASKMSLIEIPSKSLSTP